jgi:hypothetical protein
MVSDAKTRLITRRPLRTQIRVGTTGTKIGENAQMDIQFLGQPLSQPDQLGRVLKNALADAKSFWALVTWAQVSGLAELEVDLRGLEKRGGETMAIVGIGGGIATKEGLELALDLLGIAVPDRM